MLEGYVAFVIYFAGCKVYPAFASTLPGWKVDAAFVIHFARLQSLRCVCNLRCQAGKKDNVTVLVANVVDESGSIGERMVGIHDAVKSWIPKHSTAPIVVVSRYGSNISTF